MSLARGLTTTSTRKRKEKITKAKQEELERGWRERNQRLKEMHLSKETFEQYLEWVYGKGRKEKRSETHRPGMAKTVSRLGQTGQGGRAGKGSELVENVTTTRSPDWWTTGPCSSPPTPTYTGTKVIGIAVMHKSNAVPIFSNEEAVEVSSMRR